MADAAVIDVEKVNVAEILDREESKVQGAKLLAAFEANPAARKVLEAVKTAEDAYQIVKNAVKITLEDFKVLFDKTVDYFKGDKAALNDETLECVSGGWNFLKWWDEHKKQIVMGVCIVAGAAAGLVFGGIAGAVEGALIGGCAGVLIGGAMGAAAAYTMPERSE